MLSTFKHSSGPLVVLLRGCFVSFRLFHSLLFSYLVAIERFSFCLHFPSLANKGGCVTCRKGGVGGTDFKWACSVGTITSSHNKVHLQSVHALRLTGVSFTLLISRMRTLSRKCGYACFTCMYVCELCCYGS